MTHEERRQFCIRAVREMAQRQFDEETERARREGREPDYSKISSGMFLTADGNY